MVDQNGKLDRSVEKDQVCSPSTPHRINMTNITNNLPNNVSRKLEKKSNVSRIAGKVGRPAQQSVNKNSKDSTVWCSPNKVQTLEKKRTKRTNKNARRLLSPKSLAVDNSNHKLTEYFPVRRSIRKTKTEVLEEKQRDIENKILDQVESGLEVRIFPGKGRGVVTKREFKRGEFVVEYIGELIDIITAKERESIYAKDQNTGCYMYYFQYHSQRYCVDATSESDKLGRLVNHSRNGNLLPRVFEVKNKPHLVLIAKEDISAGVELSYDYGDRRREALHDHPWLAL